MLASGGLDSSCITAMAVSEGDAVYPLFVDYGQLAAEHEWAACVRVCGVLGTAPPERVDLAGFGAAIPSGLTTPDFDIVADAYLPGRNALLVLVGASYASQHGCSKVAIGLLNESDALFPDQTAAFVTAIGQLVQIAVDPAITVLAPLASLTKGDVVVLARGLGIDGTYSCHAGDREPCGACISCREFLNTTIMEAK